MQAPSTLTASRTVSQGCRSTPLTHRCPIPLTRGGGGLYLPSEVGALGSATIVASSSPSSASHGGRQVGSSQQVLTTQRQPCGHSELAVQGTHCPCRPQKPLFSVVIKQWHSGLPSQWISGLPSQRLCSVQWHSPLSTGIPPRLRHRRRCLLVRASACSGNNGPMAKAKAPAPIHLSAWRREMLPSANPVARSSK